MRSIKDDRGQIVQGAYRLGASVGLSVAQASTATAAYAADSVVRISCDGQVHVNVGVNATAANTNAIVWAGGYLIVKVKAGERIAAIADTGTHHVVCTTLE